MRKLTTALLAISISVGLQASAFADDTADALATELMAQLGNGRPSRPRLPQVYLAKGLVDIVGGGIGIVSWTGSMVPCLTYNDLLIYLPVKIEDLKIGDIVVYRGLVRGEPGQIVHRVISKEISGYAVRVKGDANQDPDDLLIKQDILVGRVKYVIQNNGQIRDFTKEPFGATTTYKNIAASAPMMVENLQGERIYIER